MIVTKPLVLAYAALTAVAVIMVVFPRLSILVYFLTFGLGMLIPSIWLYVTAIIPGLLLYKSGVHWSLAALVGVTVAAALAIIPARIAAPRALHAVLDLTADDFRKPLPLRPERIELIRDHLAFVRKGDDPVKHAACDEICQHLLLTRQVTTVTVIAHAMYSEPPVVVSYSLAAMAKCPVAFDIQNTNVLRSTTKARIAGLCIIPARGIGMTDGISISERELVHHLVPKFSLTTLELARRVDVSERRQGKDIPLLRSTEVEIGSASAPFMIFPYAGLLTTVSGIGIAKDYRTVNKQPLLALMDQLGFSLVPDAKRRDNMPLQMMISLADEPLHTNRTMVLSYLAQPGSDRFDRDQQDAVNK